MKVRLLLAFAFLTACQIAAPAQQKNEQNVLRCAGFTTPVVKPGATETQSLIIKPDALIDYKLIIANPCTETGKIALPVYEGFKLESPVIVKTINPVDEINKFTRTFPSVADYLPVTAKSELIYKSSLDLNQR